MSLTARAAVAVLLAVCFYGLALSLAGGLLWLAWADATMGRRVHPKLIIVCVFAAGVIVWSVFPRIDRFEAPGVLLEPRAHPRFFAVLERVCQKVGQPMPSEVYLVNEVNAFVAERGGWMGLGSRRVMGVGLPLLGGLDEAELQSVIAHELGHFVGGDTKLGPWIHKTRMAMARAVENLSNTGSLLTYPFVWYTKFFLRITQAISRAQEYAADRVAATVAGVAATASALGKVESLAMLHDAFLHIELSPVVAKGHAVPLDGGFRQFLGSSIARKLEAIERPEHEPDPFDSHPPTRERVAALRRLDPSAPSDPRDASAPRASSLLDALPGLEVQLLEHVTGERLATAAWDDVGHLVYAADWRETAARVALPSTALAALRGLRADAARLGDGEEHRGLDVLTASVGVVLVARGFHVEALPGEPLVLRRGDDAFDLRARLAALVDDAAEADWRAWVARAGLDDVVVGAAAT
jgi:Zn-dependent protease with chaperone function